MGLSEEDRVEDHFLKLGRLLEMESRAEADQIRLRRERRPADEVERAGDCIIDLVVTEEYAGLGGRSLVTMVKQRNRPLPWTRFGVGTPVLVVNQKDRGDAGQRGVVCEKSEQLVRVALNEPLEDETSGVLFRLDLAPDEAARLRQRAALDKVRNAKGDRLAELRETLLGWRAPEFDDVADVSILDPELNPSQVEAVQLALAARDVALLHGPPGTGKTTTVVEVIRQAVRRGERVLVCAPSNLAVDNVLERLLFWNEEAVRIGHPARVMPALREHTLDLMVEQHADVKLARRYQKEATALFRQAAKFTRGKPPPGYKQGLRSEARGMLDEARRLEAQAVERILDETPIVCATLTGLDSEVLGRRYFDLLVIDEACQSTEPGCWIPLLRVNKVVLAGDHCQLPPTILSREAMAEGFGISLLERLAGLYGPQITRRLKVQYRMHANIMAFSSREFYDNELIADESVSSHLLRDLPGVVSSSVTDRPVEFIDTAGASYDEEQEPDGESRLNPQEANLVVAQVQALLQAGLDPTQIAVIAPYSAQVRHLRDRLRVTGLEIDSIDGFQGREKEAVVISLVRSNPTGEIGFLGDVRRINVALTRARRKLIVIGDSATLSSLPFYQRLLEHFEAIGAYRTVWEMEV
jgi:superfamily I DNA and/or RNA helicase